MMAQDNTDEESKNLALLKETVAQMEESHDTNGDAQSAANAAGQSNGAHAQGIESQDISVEAASAEDNKHRQRVEAQKIETTYQ